MNRSVPGQVRTDFRVRQTSRVSPVSRGRKGKQKKSTRRTRLVSVSAADECGCPACTGADFDPERLIEDLIESAAELVEAEDPLEAEIAGAAIVALGAPVGAMFQEALAGGFVPAFEASGGTGAVAMLRAIGAVQPGPAGAAAVAAADRLVRAGVAEPGWVAELAEPVTVSDCLRLADTQSTASILVCSFHRAGRSHAILTTVNHDACGAADDITLFDADLLPKVLAGVQATGRNSGFDIATQALDPAEFRWQVEKALDARAVHDRDDAYGELPEPSFDEGGPGYPALAELLRVRMSALPVPDRPVPPHGSLDVEQTRRGVFQALAQVAGTSTGVGGLAESGRRGKRFALPAKRTKRDQPAPVYQIKVQLRGAKPPIWRRLEVPADIRLDWLHSVIQVAFGWQDYHLHAFDTPFGQFGTADADLGQRAETRVTLEQVAPTVDSKLRYTYDFGDDWEHDIVVEKVVDADPAVTYPRCTGGRRAAPPEDCGGVWAYAELVEILSDPRHPEHGERVEWLGLDGAADFDPARFDAAAVTQALSG